MLSRGARQEKRAALSRIVAANVDQVLVVFAAAEARAATCGCSTGFSLIAEGNSIPARIIFNKVELVGGPSGVDAIARDYERAGYDVHRTSVKAKIGLEGLHDVIAGKDVRAHGAVRRQEIFALRTRCFQGSIHARPRSASRSTRDGIRPVGALLVPIPDVLGGFVVDTPGLREVRDVGTAERRSRRIAFRVSGRFSELCKFTRTARTIMNQACAIRSAVEAEADFPGARTKSYLKLREELSEAEDR